MKFFPFYMAILTFISSGWIVASGNVSMTLSTWIGLLIFPFLIVLVYPINILLFKAYQNLTDHSLSMSLPFRT
ncbi:hypothetical protein MKY91_11955 [Alkalicoccobacillus gibsonii]|uniref:Uncharacterized protein n=1 Tax=Alkalicoccobacillus gibsonii TaxID=79881 RepID=A0ABU9VJ11_9BACI